MKIIPSSIKGQYLAKRAVFLLTVSLLVGIAGYGGTCDVYNPPPSENLEIRTWYDLDAVRDNLDGDHTLMNDLDSTTAGYTELASPTANGGKGWEPIEYSTYAADYDLSGTFDGQGHEIRDLFINRPDENGVALFSSTLQSAVIKNLGVMNVTITGADYVGGLVGSNTGSIINSYFSGNVTGEYRVGGLAGCSGGAVFNSYSSGDVTGSSSVGGLFGVSMGNVSDSHSMCSVIGVDDVGGLVGYSYFGTISNSYSTGNVNGYSDVGGLVGFNGWAGAQGSTVADSYSTGSIAGHEFVGGLVGCNYLGTVSNSYSTGDVTGYSYVAGLVGFNGWGVPGGRSAVANSYSTGGVTGTSHVGGLVGENNAAVTSSFWDTQTSGRATSDGGTGKNTAQMKRSATFSGAAWNITAVALNETNLSYVWNIVTDVTYPFLSRQS